MGPHHPATHGVLRLLVSLQGEGVIDLKPVIGLRAHRDREVLRGQELLEGDPVRRADGLPLLLLQHGGVLRLRRAAARARDPAARQVPARAPPGAQPDPLAPGLAGHLGARPRRDLDALVLLPRARHDPRPVRDVGGPADAHPLLPGRRRLRGHPRRLRARRCAPSARRCPSRIDQYEALLDRNEIFLQRTRDVGIVSRERLLELGVTGPLLRAAGEPWDLRKADPLPRLRRLRLQDPGRHGRRRLRPLPGPRCQEMRESLRIIEQASTAFPRARGSPTTASSSCRRATSSRPRWRR